MERTIGPRLLALLALIVLALFPPNAAARSRSAKPPHSTSKKTPPQPKPNDQEPAARSPTSEPVGADVTELQLAFDVPKAHPGARVVVTARLRDSAGRPRDAALRLETDVGVIDAPVRVSQGVYTARIALPTTLRGRRSLLVFGAAGQAASTVALPLASGPAAVLSVEAPGDLPADGANHPLWIGVTDAHGNPVDDLPRIVVTRGELGEPVAVGAGEWMVDYRPPRTSWGGEEVVRVKAGAAERSQTLALAPVPAVLTVAPKAGVVLGGGGAALAVAADVGGWLPEGPPALGVVLGVAWWSTSESNGAATPAGALDLRSQRAWLPVTLSIAARQALGNRGTVTLSLGGGGALVWSKATLAGQPELSESGWAPTAMAGVQVAFRTRFGAPFAEVRGGWIGAPHLDTLRGAAWPVMFLLGSRFDAY